MTSDPILDDLAERAWGAVFEAANTLGAGFLEKSTSFAEAGLAGASG